MTTNRFRIITSFCFIIIEIALFCVVVLGLFIDKMAQSSSFFYDVASLYLPGTDRREEKIVKEGEMYEDIDYIDISNNAFMSTIKGEDDELQLYDYIVNKVDYYKNIIEYSSNDNFIFRRPILRYMARFLYGIYGTSDLGCNATFTMNNGYIAYEEPLIKMELLERKVNSVKELSEWLNKKGIPFIYINEPSKVSPFDKQLPQGAIEFTNENQDLLLSSLNEKGVDCFDLRRALAEEKGDEWYDEFYKTDPHWKPTTGLWAARAISEILNDNYGYNFDNVKLSRNTYIVNKNREFWIGSQAREILYPVSDKEDFELLIPKYYTNYSVEIPQLGKRYNGSYEQVFIQKAKYDDISNYDSEDLFYRVDAYNCSRLQNYGEVKICNHNHVNNDKKIIILQDSYSFYLTSYLASDVKYINTVYLDNFYGNFTDYLEDEKPDLVIMMYCAKQIGRANELYYWKNKE